MTTTISGSTGVNQITDDAITDAKLPAGSVLQVVYGSTTTEVSTASTSAYVDTGITATITPSSTSSKILVTWSIQAYNSGYNASHKTMLVKDSTQLRAFDFNMYASDQTVMAVASYQHLDSPSTTSATTYKLQVKVNSGTLYCQYDDANNDGVSTITLMEIAG
jgi:hypothetical protein